MKIYDSIGEYLKNHKAEDRLFFEGHGITDGFKHIRKNGTYRVTRGTTEDHLSIKAYNGRKDLTIDEYNWNQKVAVLTSKEFSQLPKY